jgi:hypothetical protein
LAGYRPQLRSNRESLVENTYRYGYYDSDNSKYKTWSGDP